MMNSSESLSRSPEETFARGKALAASLPPGTILALDGDLGAGKTQLTKGLVAGLGGDPRAVSSPTFTLLHEYPADGLTIYHLDFYRLEEPDELLQIGWDEVLEDPRSLIVIEWPSRFPELLPKATLKWQLSITGRSERKLVTPVPPPPTP
ncbi:MAG: tRNA (adenosine(37)-N6)-threonylcarbamoyltransferase complex ATPase subunit type 1 TsaE [Verrucomicrobiota bacterium]